MIKQTFWNLSDIKREELIFVAKKEFSIRPIHEATVANIAKGLGIARSSFYNYFDNIEDLYFYILRILKNNFKQMISNNIERNNGDIFQAFIESFNYIIDIDEKEVESGIIRNLFVNSSGLTHNFVAPLPDKEELDEAIKVLDNIVNKDNLKIAQGSDLLLLVQILTDNFFQSIIHYYISKSEKKPAKENFKNKINIIKYGICKEEK